MSDSSSGPNINNTNSGEELQPEILSSLNSTSALNNKAATVPDGVKKMSFHSLSNEITIYEIKTPGPNPEILKGNCRDFRSSFNNHFEFSNDMACDILEQGDDDDDDVETRMDAALMLETELVEDPIDEQEVFETTPNIINQTTNVTTNVTTTTVSPPSTTPATVTVTPKFHHLHNINNSPQIGSSLGSSGRSPMKIISVTTNPVKTNPSVSVSLSGSSVPDVETTTTTVDSKEMDIKVVSMGGSSVGVNAKGMKIPTRRKKRKRVFTPSRLANTSIYRTRTVVKAATLAAQNQLATENAEKHKALLTPQVSQQSSFLSRAPASPKAKTMKEVLASIPGFAVGRPRKRHYRKLSTAAQLEQTKKDGSIDLETPGSILTQVNLKSILNKHTFYLLPPLYQFKLLQLLPEVDGITGSDPAIKLSNSALSNEFFTKSCQEWTEKLSAGELTVDQRQRNKQEAERERLKLDPWKVKHFEPIWGMKGTPSSSALKIQSKSQTPATVTKPSRTLTPPPVHGLRRSPARQILRLSPRFDSQNFVNQKGTLPRSSSTILNSKTLAATMRRKPELILDDDDDVDDDDVDDEDYVSEEDEEDSDDEPVITPSVRRLDSKTILSSRKHPNIFARNSPSPSNKRPASRTDKPPGLIKKIKIIPPMPPDASGKQVAFNMEVKVEEIQPATPVLTPSTDPDDVEGDITELMDEDIIDEKLTIEHVEEKIVVVPFSASNVAEVSNPNKYSSTPVSSSGTVVPDKSLDIHSSATSLPLSKSRTPVSTLSTECPVKPLASSSKSFNSAASTLLNPQSLPLVRQQSVPSATTTCSPVIPTTSPSTVHPDVHNVQSSQFSQSPSEGPEIKTILPNVSATAISSPPSNITLETKDDVVVKMEHEEGKSSSTSPTHSLSLPLTSPQGDEKLLPPSSNLLSQIEGGDTFTVKGASTTDSVSCQNNELLSNSEATPTVADAEATLQIEAPVPNVDEKNMDSSSQTQKVTPSNCPLPKGSSSSCSNTEQKTVDMNNPPISKVSVPLSTEFEPSKALPTLDNISSNQKTTTTALSSVSASSLSVQTNKLKGSSPDSSPSVNCVVNPTADTQALPPTKVIPKVTNDPGIQMSKSVNKVSTMSKSEPVSPPKPNKAAVSSGGSSQPTVTVAQVQSKSTSIVGLSQKGKVVTSSCSSVTERTQTNVPKKTSTAPTQVVLKAKEGHKVTVSGVKVTSDTITKPSVNSTSDTNSTKCKSINVQAKATSSGDGPDRGKLLDTSGNSVKVPGIVKKENQDGGKSVPMAVQETVKANMNPPPQIQMCSSPAKTNFPPKEDVKVSPPKDEFDDDCVIVTIEQKETLGATKALATNKATVSEVVGMENRTNQPKKDDNTVTQQQQPQKRDVLRGKQIVKEPSSSHPSPVHDKKKIVGQQKKEGSNVVQVNTIVPQQQQQSKENQKRQQQPNLSGHELSTISTTKMTALSPAQVAIAIAKATNQLAKNPDVTLKPLMIKTPAQIPTTKIGTQLQNVKTVQLQIRPASTTSVSVSQIDQITCSSGTVKGGNQSTATTTTVRSQPVYVKMIPMGVPLAAKPTNPSDNSTTNQVEGGKIPNSPTCTLSTKTNPVSTDASTTLSNKVGMQPQNPPSILVKVQTNQGVGSTAATTSSSAPIPTAIATTVAASSSSSIGGSKVSTPPLVTPVGVSLTPVVTVGSSSVVTGTGAAVNDKLAGKSSINVVVSNQNQQSQSSLQNAQAQQQAKVNSHHQFAGTVPNPNPALVGSSQANSKTQAHHKSRPQKVKQLKMPRTSSVPPGSINLERSYQICQAVIQNSPNREQLQNQLVKPPTPTPLKIDPTKILQHQQFNQQQSLQGHQIVTNDSTLIQVQRRSTTPTIIQTPLQGTSVPMMQPHQKVIVALSAPPGGGNGPMTITQHHLHAQSSHGQQQQQQHHGGTTVVPLIRPVQPGSPIVVHHHGPQLVVSSGTPSSSVGNSALTNTIANNLCSNVTSNTVPVNLVHMGVGMGHAIGSNISNHQHNSNHGPTNHKFPQIHQPTLQTMQMPIQMQAASSSHSANHLNSSINNNSNNHVQTQSTPPATATIITPQQLAMLIQQQQQQQSPQQQANCQQRSQTMVNVPLSLPLSSVQSTVTLPFSTQTMTTRPLTYPNRPNSASSVQSVLSHMSNNSNSSSPSSVFIQSGTNPSSSQPITVSTSTHSVTGTTSAIKIISSNSFFHQPNVRSIPHTIHIPINSQANQIQIQQRQQQQANSNILRQSTPQTQNSTFNLNNGNNSGGFPVRAQIVTSNGETLTIHRASSIPINSLSSLTNGPIRLRNINMAQVKRTPGGSFVISSSGGTSTQDGNNVRSSPNTQQQQQTFLSGNEHTQLISTGHVQNQLNVVNSIAVSAPTSNTITMTRSQNQTKSQQQTSQMMRCPLRIISHPISHGNVESFQSQNFSNNSNLSLNNENSSSSQQSATIINSVSNLADFITNQLAASNIGPISPLAFENGQRGSNSTVTASSEGERNSPNVFSIQSQSSQQQQQSNFVLSEISDMTNSQSQQVEHHQGSSSSVVLVSVLNPSSASVNQEGNSNGGILRKGNQNVEKFTSQSPIADLINCTSEAVLDLQDAISVNVDSPYSLISEPDPPNIAEIIDVPTTIENIENISSVSSSNSNSNVGTSSTFFPNGNCSIASPIWINSASEPSNPSPGLQIQIQDNSSSCPLPPPQSVHNVSVTNNNNKRRLDAPVVVSEVDRNTLLVQAQSHQQQTLSQQQGSIVQRIDSPNQIAGRSTEGIRQQQYIIVQTTGSNGLPTNLAVPASIMISPQVLMDQANKGPPRASSAPPVQNLQQHNHTVILNAHDQNVNTSIPISFAGPQGHIQSGSIMTMTPVSVSSQNTITVHPVNTTGQQLGDNSGLKSVHISPLDIQDSSGVRVLYSGQNGSGTIQSMTLNQFQQQQRQQQQQQQTHPNQCLISQNRGSPIQYTQIPTQTLQQQIVAASASQNVIQNSTSFPVTGQSHSNIVQTQVSQAPTIVHQQTVSQVLNVGSANLSSNPPPNVVNLNLNGQSSSTVSRIITTTQHPGQHPVISIPDTTQNCGGSGSVDTLLGQEYDIFSAITEGVNVKVDGLVNRASDCNGNGTMNTVNPESLGLINVNLSGTVNDSVTGSNNNNNRLSNSDFQGVVEEVGQIILDSGGNCVCDLRAMIMCRKCGAYCHPEHHPPHKRNCLKETV